MVEHRLLVETESAQVASQANALPPLMGKDVTPSGLLPSPRSRPTGSDWFDYNLWFLYIRFSTLPVCVWVVQQ